MPWTTDAALSRAAALGSDRIAVVLGEDGSSMSYGALDEQATRLANALGAHGVVGCFELHDGQRAVGRWWRINQPDVNRPARL